MSEFIQGFFSMATSFQSKIDRKEEHVVRRSKIATFHNSYTEKSKDDFEATDIF